MNNTEQQDLETEMIYVADGERLVLACDCRRIEVLETQLQQARDVFVRLCGEWFVPDQLRREMNKVLEAK
jgi:hypothetical protein